MQQIRLDYWKTNFRLQKRNNYFSQYLWVSLISNFMNPYFSSFIVLDFSLIGQDLTEKSFYWAWN